MRAMLARITRILGPPGSPLARVLFSVLTLVAGMLIGRHWLAAPGTDEATVARMQAELSALDAALRAARGDLEMRRTRHEVDKHALELLRSEIAAEKIRTAELEEGLSFYRSMVVSEDVSKGLSLRTPELVPGDKPEHVRYRFFVQQKDREYEIVEGRLSVDVFGISGDREVTYPLGKLSIEFDEKAATLHFRYFQAIEGQITLPDGFEPRGMLLTARARKPREMEVREEFPWKVQERFINVGE